jgi:hypothetical protein
MTDNSDGTGRQVHSAPDTAEEVTDESRDAAKSAAEQTRKVAKEAFEHIKAARARAAKLID